MTRSNPHPEPPRKPPSKPPSKPQCRPLRDQIAYGLCIVLIWTMALAAMLDG